MNKINRIMKKVILFLFTIILVFIVSSCSNDKSTQPSNSTTETSTIIPSTYSNPTTTEPKEDGLYMNKTIELKMGNTKVDVYLLNNASINTLKELVKDGLTINMSMYGDVE